MPRRRPRKPEIQAIIFDIGRVIVKLDPRRAIATIGASSPNIPKESPEKIWTAIQEDSLWIDWQEGRVTPREWYRHLTARFHAPMSFEDFRAAWNSVILPEPDLLLPDSLFARLSGRCRLVLLSNTDPLHVKHLESDFRFLRHFPARIYSCRAGSSKPSPAIFRTAIRAAGVPPSRTLFIDDIRPFVLAARRMGLDAVQFRSRLQIEAALRLRHLL